jgi:outer membrane protein OmpA-like peptidoglycan-associated protein
MNARTLLIKIFKGLAIVGGVLLFYALAGFYALPYLVKSRGPEMIKELTGREASIAKVELNPFLFRFAIQGLVLQEKNGQPFVSFERFAADIELWRSLKEAALTIDDVQLIKPFVRLARHKTGQFNFADLVSAKEEPSPETEHELFPMQIDRLALAGGKLLWEDQQFKKPVREEIVPIDLTIERFSLGQNQPFSLHLKLALKSGGTLDWQGEAGIEPLYSKGRLKLDQIKLQNLTGAALQDTVSFDLRGGEALEAEYRFNYSAAKGLELEIPKSHFELKDFVYAAAESQKPIAKSSAISLNAGYKITYAGQKWQVATEKADVILRDLDLTGMGPVAGSLNIPEIALTAACNAGYMESGFNLIVQNGQMAISGSQFFESNENKPLIKIERLAGEGIDLDLLKSTVSVKAIKSENADIQAWLTKEGKLNYLTLLPEKGMPPTAERAAQPAEKTSEPWTIALKSIALTGFGLNFEDRTQTQPVVVQVKPIDFTLRDFTSTNGAKLPVQLSVGFNQHGHIKLDGDVVINPLTVQLNVSIGDIALDKFQTYVDQFARLDVIDGGFFAEGKLDVHLKEQQPDIKFQGLAGVDELVTRDQLQNKDFIKWKKLTLNGIDADLLANRYTAKRLLIEKPYARVLIKKDKTVNVNEVLSTGQRPKTAGDATGKKPKSEKEQSPTFFKLDQIVVHDGSSDFADLSLILPFAAEIQELNGGASGFSSEKESKVKVSLKGNAYDLAPVDVHGEVSPYRGDYNVELSFHGLPMPLVSPYMVQFAGYKVEKGKLNLDLKYQVEKGALTASNNILIDQFELGEKVENPNAVSLPLDLAVALLKDGDNRIKLDVPITGSLEDPKFSIRAIVADALLNALKKVIASPFKALASMFKEGENLDHIDFKAGKAELDKDQSTKLDGLAKALKERPALNLEIKGAAYEEQDWPALKDAALYDQLKRLKAAAIAKKGKKIRAEYIELSDDEYKDYLAQMFIEKFPLLAERSLFGKPRLIDSKEGNDFYEVAKQKLFTIIKPEEERLKGLAAKRAQAIAKYVVQQGGILPERVFILDTAINPEREGQTIVSRLSLKAH